MSRNVTAPVLRRLDDRHKHDSGTSFIAATVWNGGVPTELGSLGATYSEADGIRRPKVRRRPRLAASVFRIAGHLRKGPDPTAGHAARVCPKLSWRSFCRQLPRGFLPWRLICRRLPQSYPCEAVTSLAVINTIARAGANIR